MNLKQILRFSLCFGILILHLMSCSSTDSWYVSEEKWIGMETHEYEELYAKFVANHPLGSPNPEPDKNRTLKSVDLDCIRFQTKKSQYSLSMDEYVEFEISYILPNNDKTDYKNEYVDYAYYQQNLELWYDESWKRVIDVNNMWEPNPKGKTILDAGETEEGVFHFGEVITVLTPGKYRLVAYVNYEPVYAEFELTE